MKQPPPKRPKKEPKTLLIAIKCNDVLDLAVN